jgi:hypothetical protein
MPRPSIDPFWREQVRSITANNPRLGPGPLLKQLETVGAQVGRRDWPSQRTIGRIQAQFRLTPEAVRREYLEFRWPEAMERGDLPWEATLVAIECLRAVREDTHGLGPLVKPRERPSISVVRWLWRVTLAVPDQPLRQRLFWALLLARSANPALDARRAIEAIAVNGVVPDEGAFFGERVSHDGLRRLVKSFAQARANEDVSQFLQAMEEGAWESEPTERGQSSAAGTDAGAQRSRRAKGAGSTS